MECLWVYAVSKGVNASGGAGGAGWHFRLLDSKGENRLKDRYPELNIRIAGGNIPPVNLMYAPNMKEPTTEKDIIISPTGSATDDEIAATYYTAATEPPRTLKFLQMASSLKDKRPFPKVFLIRRLSP